MDIQIHGVAVLRLPAVKRQVGLGKSSIYAGIKKGTFPPPIKLGERASGWLEAEISNWIEARITSTRNGVSA
jgi:prophage regulatory protein